MKKGSIIYIVVIALGILILFMFESSMPKKIDWREQYAPEGTNPYDLKIFSEQLEASDVYHSIDRVEENFYEYSRAHEADWQSGSYLFLFVGDHFDWDSVASEKLYRFAAAGNDVLIVANYFNHRTYSRFKKSAESNFVLEGAKTKVTLYNGQAAVEIAKMVALSYIQNEDTTPFYALGSLYLESEGRSFPNFVRMPHGKGNLFLHATPIVFTNYYLLYRDAADYVSNVLSHSPKKKVLLYTGPPVGYNQQKVGSNILKYILENVQLRYAWYLALLSILLFMIFNAKRRQRVVPVIKPLENTTVGFAKTIANLFYETQNHHFIINRRMVYFLEHIRSSYYLDTQVLDDTFAQYLSLKSGVREALCLQLIREIALQRLKHQSTRGDLVRVNQLLEQFKKEEIK